MNITTVKNALSDRFDHVPAWVVIIQLFIGMGWTRAGVEKLLSGDWWSGLTLRRFVADHDEIGLPLYHSFVDAVIVPNAAIVSLVVMLLQFAVGAALIAGRFPRAALAVGMFMNLNFVAAGAVDPSVFYLLSQGAVMLWLAEHSSDARTERTLDNVAIGGAGLAAFSLPSVTTIAPEQVIHDPAIVLVTVGLLAVVGATLCKRQRLLAMQPAPSVLAPSRAHDTYRQDPVRLG